jgi:response regulator RpfG family c-di-GMP phosphodiesterase
MTRKVLFVDDEKHILDTFRASLRKRFKVDVALGPEEGLKKIKDAGPFAVVVSDLKMPQMDGISFLSKVQEISPDTVRVMLTGHAGLESAIDAVNKGAVFRFLTKPSPIDEMIRTLEVALDHYSLVVAEKELLRGTLRGSIKVLTDVLALVNPEAFGRSERVKRLAVHIGQNLKLKNTLSLELAAMLSQIGCVTLPDTLLSKVFFGEELNAEEREAYATHPAVASQLLSHIPRMGAVSDIILHQEQRLNEHPELSIEGRILKACLDYDSLIQRGLDKHDAIDALRSRQGWYDTDVLDVLERGTAGEEGYIRREVDVDDLKPGMILDDSLWSLDKVHIMGKGMEVTETGLLRLENFRRSKRLPTKIRVMIPLE